MLNAVASKANVKKNGARDDEVTSRHALLSSRNNSLLTQLDNCSLELPLQIDINPLGLTDARQVGDAAGRTAADTRSNGEARRILAGATVEQAVLERPGIIDSDRTRQEVGEVIGRDKLNTLLVQEAVTPVGVIFIGINRSQADLAEISPDRPVTLLLVLTNLESSHPGNIVAQVPILLLCRKRCCARVHETIAQIDILNSGLAVQIVGEIPIELGGRQSDPAG